MHKATETTGTAAKRPMPGTFRFNLHRSDSGVYPPSGYRAICAAKPISRPDPSTGNRLPETWKHREPMIRSVFRGGQPTRHAKLIKDLKYSRRMTVSADKKRKTTCISASRWSLSGTTRNRTGDTRIFSPLLYQLSYGTILLSYKTRLQMITKLYLFLWHPTFSVRFTTWFTQSFLQRTIPISVSLRVQR